MPGISLAQRASVRGRVWPKTLRRRAAWILAGLGPRGEGALSIVLTDDQEICALNRTWRGIDRPTDVLSFPMLDAGEAIADGAPCLLGDVVISVDTAARQIGDLALPVHVGELRGVVGDRGWSLLDEITFLLLHGVLHLVGYDHLQPEDAARMHAKERELLPTLLRYSK